jgi:3-methyladenine DNA glycosylase AlkD
MNAKPKAATRAPDLRRAQTALRSHANAANAAVFRSFFKDGTDDVFLGVTTPLIRKVAKEHWELSFDCVQELMWSPIHEERSLSHAILVIKFQKSDDAARKHLVNFYLKNRRAIKEWDGVDGSAPYILGPFLINRNKKVLYQLIRSPRIWDRRIALVATLPMIRQGLVKVALRLSELVLGDREDLIHKASGWMLREVGKRNLDALEDFLKKHAAKMPRTMLRYAIERFPEPKRQRYLKAKQSTSRIPGVNPTAAWRRKISVNFRPEARCR